MQNRNGKSHILQINPSSACALDPDNAQLYRHINNILVQLSSGTCTVRIDSVRQMRHYSGGHRFCVGWKLLKRIEPAINSEAEEHEINNAGQPTQLQAKQNLCWKWVLHTWYTQYNTLLTKIFFIIHPKYPENPKQIFANVTNIYSQTNQQHFGSQAGLHTAPHLLSNTRADRVI